MHQGRRPLIRRSGRVWAQAAAIVCVGVLAVVAVAAAAPKGDQGPPPQAQGNGPPPAPPKAGGNAPAREAPAAGVTTRAGGGTQRQPAAGQATGGGSGKARSVGHARTSGATTGGSATTVGDVPATGHGSTGTSRAHSGQAGKARLCHATGSGKNPSVESTVSGNAVPAQGRRRQCSAGASQSGGQDDGDAPSGTKPPAGPLGRSAPADDAPSDESGSVGVSDDDGAVPGAGGGVLGADQGGGDEGDGTFGASIASLPFTGLGLGVLVALGAMLALAGLYVRRRTV